MRRRARPEVTKTCRAEGKSPQNGVNVVWVCERTGLMVLVLLGEQRELTSAPLVVLGEVL